MKINGFVPDDKIFTSFNNNSDQSSTVNESGLSFIDLLKDKLDEVNTQQVTADNLTQSFVKGDETDVSKVMLSSEEAKLSLDLAVQIRNKLVDAYQEINRMQL